MSNRLAFQTQLASIMEDLANAAVAEICKLVDDDYAVVSLQMSQCQRENKALKRKLHLLELKMARGHAERRLRESGTNSYRPRVQIVTGDRRRDSSPPPDQVFEQQMDHTQWSDKDATGDTGNQPVHSDNIQSQLQDVELLEPGVMLVKEENVEANVSCTEEMEDTLPVKVNGVIDRVHQTGVSGQRLQLEESIQNQTQHSRTRSTGNNISSSSSSRGVEKNKEPDVVLVKVEGVDPQRAAQKWIDLSVHKGLLEVNADDYRGGLPFDATQAPTNPVPDLQESVEALSEVDYGHTSLWTNGESSYCLDSSLSRPSSHCAPLSFLPDTLIGAESGRGPVALNSTGGVSAVDGSVITLSEDSSSSQAQSRTQGEQLCVQHYHPFLNQHQSKGKGTCKVSRKRCFICRFCGKGFSSQANLESHLRTHTGERPYGCSICGKKFSQFWNLKIHRHIHTGERPYECSLCPEKFSDPSNLKKHQRRHHTQR